MVTETGEPGTARPREQKLSTRGSQDRIQRPHDRVRSDYPEMVQRSVDYARDLNMSVEIPSFEHAYFDTFEDFVRVHNSYAADNFCKYRRRQSETRVTYNNKLEEDDPNRLPDHLSHSFIRYQCVHGVYQPPRGSGAREQVEFKLTECPARITAEAKFDVKTNDWFVQVDRELCVHNHDISRDLYDSYATSSEIPDEVLFNTAREMVRAGGSTARICDVISRRLGRVFTPKQLYNWHQYRLGGSGAKANVDKLVGAFAEMTGNDCLVLHDQEDQICGIVLQSRIQRAYFDRWGDSLLLDWTHNTNNVGFYVGSLMVTGPSGRGVSVCDFLCIEQTEDMMSLVFEHFLAVNPTAIDKVQSIVIDKDYKEWRVLERVFKNSRVLLCQFHALKWMRFVVTMSKYEMSVAKRQEVQRIFSAMVYATNDAEFEKLRAEMDVVLKPKKLQLFRKYLEDRWYSCRRMWSNSQRGRIFTATNTTTNRLESSWNQLEKILMSDRRLDKCLEALFVHMTGVLRREEEFMRDFVVKPRFYPNGDRFIEPLLRRVSPYAAKLIIRQWQNYTANKTQFKFVAPAAGVALGDDVACVSVDGRASHLVDKTKWSCSCNAFCGSGLPCRHVFFAAKHEGLDAADVDALPERWVVQSALEIHSDLRKAIKEYEQLRIDLDVSPAPSADSQTEGGSTWLPPRRATTRKVNYVKLRRYEISAEVVLNDLEKRAIIASDFDRVTKYLMHQGTSRFKLLATHLRAVHDELLESWSSSNDPASMREVVPVGGEPVVPVDDDERAAWETYEIDTNDTDDGVEISISEPVPDTMNPALEQASDHPVGGDDCELPEALLCSPPPYADELLESTLPSESAGLDDALDLCSESTLASASRDTVGQVLRESIVGSTDLLATHSIRQLADILQEVDALPNAGDVCAGGGEEPVEHPIHSLTGPSDNEEARGRLQVLHAPVGLGTGTTRAAKSIAAAKGRLGMLSHESTCPVYLRDFVVALEHVPNTNDAVRYAPLYTMGLQDKSLRDSTTTIVKAPAPIFDTINFTIPKALLDSLKSALDKHEEKVREASAGRGKNRDPDALEATPTPKAKARVGVKISASIRVFTAPVLADISALAVVRTLLEQYVSDMLWLRTPSQWQPRGDAPPIPFLQKEADGVEGGRNSSNTIKMRDAIINVLATKSLATTFHVPGERRPYFVALRDVWGRLCGTEQLNDAVILFAIHWMVSQCDRGGSDIHVINPGLVGKLDERLDRLPRGCLALMRLVVVPVNFNDDHWCAISVSLANGAFTAHLYDPLVLQSNHTKLLKVWTGKILPYLKAWHERDVAIQRDDGIQVVLQEGELPPTFPTFPSFSTDVVRRPRQAATNGCGINVVAFVVDKINNREHQRVLDGYQVQVMRLRILWLIVCRGQSSDSADAEELARKTLDTFSKYVDEVGGGTRASTRAAKTGKPKVAAKAGGQAKSKTATKIKSVRVAGKRSLPAQGGQPATKKPKKASS